MFFTYFSSLNGQSTFNKTIDTDNGADWGVSLLIEDDSIILLGTSDKLVNGFYRDGIFFRKLDISGNIQNEKFYADSCVVYSVGSPGNISNYGVYYLANGSYQNCDTNFTADVGSNGIAYKFSADGDTIWTKKLIGNGFTIMRRSALTTINN